MNLLKAIPLSHKILWAILIVLSIMSTFNVSRVEAASCTPSSWIYGTASTSMTVGGGSGSVYIAYGYRRNGCSIEPRWVECGGHTTLVSTSTTWCGFYQPADWNKTRLHVGTNYRVCTSPVSGFGVCWSEYLRTQITARGVKSSWGSNAPFIVTR